MSRPLPDLSAHAIRTLSVALADVPAAQRSAWCEILAQHALNCCAHIIGKSLASEAAYSLADDLATRDLRELPANLKDPQP